MSETVVDFPTSLPEEETSERSDKSQGSWAVTVTDVFTAMNPKYAGGTNGLYIEILNEKSGKTRQVFYPQPSGEGKKRKVPQRTQALLKQLEKLDLSPDKIGGWDKLRGIRFAWKKEERSFTLKENGTEVEKKYELEYPIKVLESEGAAVTSNGNGNGNSGMSSMDELKALAVGKTKTELKFAVATNSRLAAEYGEAFRTNDFIDSMIDEGIFSLDSSNKLIEGENY